MPADINQTTIVNRALQLVGYQSVSSIQQNDRGARAMNRAYKPVLYSILQENYWTFAIKRATITKDTIAPEFGYKNKYKLPGDFIMLAPEYQLGSFSVTSGVNVADNFPLANDWIVEGEYILSDDDSPIDVRYVSNSVNESQFPMLFAEAFSAQLAVMTVEELTNSNTKLQNLIAIYDRQISMAKKRNFIMSPKPVAPVSPWISKRG
jgi:hypothetical protein